MPDKKAPNYRLTCRKCGFKTHEMVKLIEHRCPRPKPRKKRVDR